MMKSRKVLDGSSSHMRRGLQINTLLDNPQSATLVLGKKKTKEFNVNCICCERTIDLKYASARCAWGVGGVAGLWYCGELNCGL